VTEVPSKLRRGHVWVRKGSPQSAWVQIEAVATPTFDDPQKYVAFRQIGANDAFLSTVDEFLKEYEYDDGS